MPVREGIHAPAAVPRYNFAIGEAPFCFALALAGDQNICMDTLDRRNSDPFRPPAVPVEVRCLHCGQEYESYLIHWEEFDLTDGRHGFWCCPTPGCDGKGFGFDILPTDPNYRDERGGWIHDDEDCDEFDESDGERN